MKMESNKVLIVFKSFSDSRPRPLLVSSDVNLTQLLFDGGSKLQLKAVKAFKVVPLEHSTTTLVPFLEHTPVEQGVTLFLTKRDEKIPRPYKILDCEPVKANLGKRKAIRKPECATVVGAPEKATAVREPERTAATREPERNVRIQESDLRFLIELHVKAGIVVLKEGSASVQFAKGQAGRIIGREGGVLKDLCCTCRGAQLYFDPSTCRMKIKAAIQSDLVSALCVVLKKRLSIESFGGTDHPFVREVSIWRGGFGPIMGVGGVIKHDIQDRHSVRLGFNMKTFVVRIIGCTQNSVDSALREVQQRLSRKQLELDKRQDS